MAVPSHRPASLLVAGLGGAARGVDVSVRYLAGGVVSSALIQSFALGALLEPVRGRRRGLARASRG
ncbi:hypothetical protein ACFVH0_29855 [Streptomyces sp. NPDC127117]|uniref:hypothetical protein n=1 Tax=Streptomyces sp. NPDC127117 TaxID=3345368 RepID=UPI00363A2751